jgi:hypothetical protein
MAQSSQGNRGVGASKQGIVLEKTIVLEKMAMGAGCPPLVLAEDREKSG